MKRLGLDIGSTTLKCAVLDAQDRPVDGRQRLVYKHAISTIVPDKFIDVFSEDDDK